MPAKKRRTIADFENDALAPAPVEPAPAPAITLEPPTRAEAPAPEPRGSDREQVSVRLTTSEYADAKSAFLVDFEDMTATPDTFGGWVGHIVAKHARRSPAKRAELAEALPEPDGATMPRSLQLDPRVLEDASRTVGADRAAGRYHSRASMIREAILIATNQTRERAGGRLPAAPKRLPGRLQRP